MEAKSGEISEADKAFFKSMIRRDILKERHSEFRDFDVYLMETGVMPLLLQGLDALARHVDRIGLIPGGNNPRQDPKAKERFSPRIWLAQYILRNHPAHVHAGEGREDVPNYKTFAEWASIEKGRRELINRRIHVENLWTAMERKTQGQVLNVNHMPFFVDSLDDFWNLQGTLRSKLPKTFHEVLKKASGTDQVSFEEFWLYFEKTFEGTDLLRLEDFDRGEMRKREEDRRLAKEAEERDRKEQLSRARQERRTALTAQFETVKADLHSDGEVLRILKGGAVLAGVEDEENAVSLQGEHVQWIKQMIQLWGVDMQGGGSSGGSGVWNDAALAAWKSWAKRYSPQGGAAKVDSVNLGILMSLESYVELFLAKVFPTEAEAVASGGLTSKAMGVRRLEDRGVVYVVQAVDEETGQMVEVELPDEMAEEVKRRLATERGPLLVSVNMEDTCVTQFL